MGIWRAPFHRFLEQNGWCPWRVRRNCVVRGYHDDHSVYARRVGRIGWRFSRNDGKSRFFNERLCVAGRVPLPAQTGFAETIVGIPRDKSIRFILTSPRLVVQLLRERRTNSTFATPQSPE